MARRGARRFRLISRAPKVERCYWCKNSEDLIKVDAEENYILKATFGPGETHIMVCRDHNACTHRYMQRKLF